jgi:hypothetical protein
MTTTLAELGVALDLLEETLARMGLLMLTLRRLQRELEGQPESLAHDAGQSPRPDFDYRTGTKPDGTV